MRQGLTNENVMISRVFVSMSDVGVTGGQMAVIQVSLVGTPLCPAGHLPLKGGDRVGRTLCLH